MTLIAYYLAFCLVCCVLLMGLVHREKSRRDRGPGTD